ncbi:hypothetical protein F5Y01DRAFT_285180 [Xylaria sp. FL0043]|nr:hypothetical protein F5Y01DRAFT_285180 [Xylaria sp. FL0043]
MSNISVEMKRLEGTLFVLLFWSSVILCSGSARKNTTLTRLIYALLTSFTMCSPITMRSAILVAPNFFFPSKVSRKASSRFCSRPQPCFLQHGNERARKAFRALNGAFLLDNFMAPRATRT